MLCENFHLSAIMPRKAAESWWKIPIPPEVAYYEIGIAPWGHPPPKHAVTWDQVHEKRRDLQAQRLESIRMPDTVELPAFIWVFKNRYTGRGFCPYGGWWIYLVTNKGEYGINFRNENSSALIPQAMELYPCGIIPLAANFETWAPIFAKQHHRPAFNRKRFNGLALCRAVIISGRITQIKSIQYNEHKKLHQYRAGNDQHGTH